MNVLIVLNYNDFKTTEEFVQYALHLSSVNKIIIVDNCSTDNSFSNLEKLKSSKVDVISTKSNSGYAAGNNYGSFYAIKKYQPSHLLIANPDTILNDKLINEMKLVFSSREHVGIVSGKMRCNPGKKLPIAWKRPRYRDCVLENFIILKSIIGEKNRYCEQYFHENIVEVEALPGSFFMISSHTFNDIGGFDEDTFLYYEENILSYKLNKKGYKNYLLTNYEYIHNHSVTIDKNISSVKHKLKISEKSREIYCKKYLKVNWILCVLLKLSFKIGLFDYLLATNILSIIKSR